MIEIYVKWCCDLEHVPYKRQADPYLWNRNHDYTTKNYRSLTIDCNAIKEQMTMYDYILGEVAM